MGNKMDLAKKLGTIPAIWVWVNHFYPSVINWTKSAVEWVLSNSAITNPLFAKFSIWTIWSVIAAPMVTNDIIKSFSTLEKHKWIRYTTNAIAASVAYIGWTAATPWILWWAAAYVLGKPVFDRIVWWAYWLVWWTVKWAAKWTWQWLKWNQFKWDWWNKLNPNIS